MAQRSVLITGCSSGIGLAAAETMRNRGWRVFATARAPEDLQRLQDESGVESVYLDYTEPDSIADAVDRVLSATDGALTALFNNGAYGQAGAIEDVPTDAVRRQFETNVIGWHDLTRRVIPAMRAQGSGRIVQCSSVLGLVAAPYRGVYASTKFAIEAMSDALRMELKGSGVDVSIIEPGPIATRFVETAIKHYKANVDMENSAHAEIYRVRLAKMEDGGQMAFKLEPEAVCRRLIHALEARRPKARYYVTLPTFVGAYLRRILPARALDFVAASN
ncbi:MAG: SDR family oxidoreductase [Methyloceanibacter sp.]|nr:SDR family oxidoreductase [Methyloceanibacter sp.]